ncbi:MAG: hypothetical protein AAFW68_02355 [Pseudomonadota bacterium]
MMTLLAAVVSSIFIQPTETITETSAIEMHQHAAGQYLRSRLYDTRGAALRPKEELYSVSAVINGVSWRGYALDISLINARSPSGHRIARHRQTVLIGANGPFALKSDVKNFKKID